MSSTATTISTSPQAGKSSQRIYVLDLARFIAMVMMMQGHVLDALVTPVELNINVFPWNIWHFLRGLTAPIFLMISGAVFVFAAKRQEDGSISNQVIWKRIRWAITIMLIGYMLMFPANRLLDLFWVSPEVWKAFFQVNILQLTGISLIMLTLAAKYTRSSETFAKLSLGIGSGILLLTPFVHAVNMHGYMPEAFAAFFSYKNGSIFPIFPFSAYSFFGAAFGVFLMKYRGEDRLTVLKRKVPFVGIGVLALGIILIEIFKYLPFVPAHDLYQMSPGFALVRAGLVLSFVALVSYLYTATRSLENFYSMFGKKALHIYVGHLILLYGTPWFGSIARWHIKDMTLLQGLGIAALIISVCLGTVYLLENFKQKFNRGEIIMRYSGALILAYLLLT